MGRFLQGGSKRNRMYSCEMLRGKEFKRSTLFQLPGYQHKGSDRRGAIKQGMWCPVQTPPLPNASLKGHVEMDLI